jgi:glycosyltransferase involved in cell wall biosynthesis
MRLGIDASNLRLGGGVTHLLTLLAEAEPRRFGIDRVVVWAIDQTLSRIDDRPWLDKRALGSFGRSGIGRACWQQLVLPGLLRRDGFQALFSPGGTLPLRTSVPTVTMSQNLLPFEPGEAERYPALSRMRLKLRLLRRAQSSSMSSADGVIFLSQYARGAVERALGGSLRRTVVIPHGVEERFRAAPRPIRSDHSPSKPFRVLYVSMVDLYKHQWTVAEAVATLRSEGVPLTLDLVGPANPANPHAMQYLQTVVARLDPRQEFLFCRGPVAFEALHARYHQADAFVFASSCENLPNTLIEAMAAGLPIACSARGPMPEVLGDAGLYFDPERPREIAAAIRSLYENAPLRARLAQAAWQRSGAYSWRDCAERTFRFIAEVAAAADRHAADEATA